MFFKLLQIFKLLMKGSSRDKQSATQVGQTRLNKTQVQPPQPQTFQKTTYAQNKAPSMQLPPRSGSSQKINYKIEENMTNSKITEAKKGLLLLKKKMSRNGMSRQKNTSVQRKYDNEQPQSRKTIHRTANEEEQDYEAEINSRKPPLRPLQKQNSREQPLKKGPPVPSKPTSNKSPLIPTKNIEQDRPIKRQPPKSQFVNQVEQVPIKANQDFFAILERQMAKQAGKAGGIKDVKGSKKMQIPQMEQIQLVQCSKGCGRNFSTQAIQKHEKVCEKVFQAKRKVFNAAAQRAPEVQDFKAPPPAYTPPQQTKQKKPEKTAKVPKWKLQSQAFRAGLKQGRGQQLSKEEKAASDLASGMTQCSFCGRKFNSDAAKRHIPICQTKSKQMSKNIGGNTRKK